MPLYGDGKYIRDWLYVGDNCRALLLLLRKGEIGEIYNIGASELHENTEVAKKILDILAKPHSLIEYVQDRLGHDRRYCVKWNKIRELGWQPQAKFPKQFEETIRWYKDKINWWNQKAEEAEKFYGKENG